MTDLRTRFQTLDRLSAPDLWYSIEERAMAIQSTPRRNPWLLVAVMLLLTLIVGGAVLVGSGVIKLPAVVDASASPSATAQASIAASASPVEPVPASWAATGNMIEARDNHTATRLQDGRVLVAGGVGSPINEFSANILASAEIYDPSTRQWTATAAMLEIRAFPTALLLADGRVLVLGGSGCSDFDGCPLDSAELYDPTTGTWTATGSTSGGGTGRSATLLDDGTVLVVGGSDGSLSEGDLAPMRVAELYNPGTGEWSTTGPLVQPREGHTATALPDGKVLVVGGTDTGEVYDPSTGQWTATAAMAGVRVGHSAALLADGKVLVAGGMAGTGAGAFAELYDPGSGQWTATGDMVEGRIYHTATPLAGGRVLVTGGIDSVIDAGVPRTSVELYDPGTGQWTVTESMAVVRNGYTATLLADGTVLVTGGSDAGGSIFAAAELYDPGNN
jgi:N-acetylneuraminic acid mutarotase